VADRQRAARLQGGDGFSSDFFTDRHDPQSPDYQSTLRLLHYLPMANATGADNNGWRAGAHTDFDCLTLLHQRVDQGGLQLCPGKDLADVAWTDVDPLPGVITCNIGDMLMRWSDDKLLSTLHRVRMPGTGEYTGPRYSIAFFCQANKDAVIEGPGKSYAPITAHDYLQQRIAANYAK
jgi:isopenicillin N synthase-like dioxygenase